LRIVFVTQADHRESEMKQGEKEMEKKTKQSSSMDEQMQAWMRYAEPGKEHDFLILQEGNWHAKTKFWMDPSSPPMESEGFSENRMILGGRFLQSVYKGPTPFGPSFEGIAIDGFDKLAQKYVGIWIDSMGTMMMVFSGTVDGSLKVRTMISDYTDAMTGQPSQMMSKTTNVSSDEFIYEGLKKSEEGWKKSMEIVYTRAR
jgi:hypothetical protein